MCPARRLYPPDGLPTVLRCDSPVGARVVIPNTEPYSPAGHTGVRLSHGFKSHPWDHVQGVLHVLLADGVFLFAGCARGCGRAYLVDLSRDTFCCLIDESQRLVVEGALLDIALFPPESDVLSGLFF